MSNQYLAVYPQHAAAWLLFLCLALVLIALGLAWCLMNALDRCEKMEADLKAARLRGDQRQNEATHWRLRYDETWSALQSERIKVEQLLGAIQKRELN